MKPYAERHAEAMAYHAAAMERVRTTPPPEGQKFVPGARVRLNYNKPDLYHKMAIVCYTYAHAYGGDRVQDYCIDIEGRGQVAWFPEEVLEAAP
jgi:hypothetical protein